MSQEEISDGLDFTARRQEKELVIDLAPDRILHHIGVNLLILLAILTKLTEVTGSKVSCYPVHETKSSLQLVKYIDSFCWHSPASNHSSFVTSTSACPLSDTNLNDGELLENPYRVKRLIQWLPYVMLLQAFLFSLPMAYWHFTMGGVLLGHLKFMRLLLESIYDTLKELPAGIYTKTPFDPESKRFNCWRKWKEQQGRNTDSATDDNTVSNTHDEPNPTVTIDIERDPQNSGNDLEVTNDSLSSRSNNDNDEEDQPLVNLPPAPKNDDEKYRPRTISTSSAEARTIPSTEETSCVGKPDNIDSHDSVQSADEVTSSRLPELHDKESDRARASSRSWDDRGRIRKMIEKVIEPDFTSTLQKVFEAGGTSDEGECSDDDKECMKDRHIFSMLCYENFSSMEHQPYLESVEKLSGNASFEKNLAKALTRFVTQNDSDSDGNEGEIILPMKHAILRCFCDEKSFDASIVIGKYQRKSTWTIVLSAVVWGSLVMTFAMVLAPTFKSDSFICNIPYHGKHCSICTLSRLVDVHAAFFSNWVAITLHLIISCMNHLYFVGAHRRAVTHFMDEIKPLCCVALVAAYEKTIKQRRPE